MAGGSALLLLLLLLLAMSCNSTAALRLVGTATQGSLSPAHRPVDRNVLSKQALFPTTYFVQLSEVSHKAAYVCDDISALTICAIRLGKMSACLSQ